MEQIARAQCWLMHQWWVFLASETSAVIILSSRIKAIIILTDITGNDVAILSQATGIIGDTDIVVAGL